MPWRPWSLPRSSEALLSTVTAVQTALAVLALVIPLAGSGRPQPVVVPLAQAHAHNDYENDRPLSDALDHGFTSVEVDVWLAAGELFVAHDQGAVAPGWTLETLYLGPLAERVRANGGRVYPDWQQSFHLLIDVKSAAGPTYRAIDRALRRHRSMLTRYSYGTVRGGPVTVTISGNRARGLVARQPVRYAALDGRIADLDRSVPTSLVPLVSDSWTETFTWHGVGPMPERERRELRGMVSRAHADGRRVRFWGTSDLPLAARRRIALEGLAAGVDYLDTEHLSELRQTILAEDASPSDPLVEWWAPVRGGRRS